MDCVTGSKSADMTVVSMQIRGEKKADFLNLSKFLEWTIHSFKAETHKHTLRHTEALLWFPDSTLAFIIIERTEADADAKCLQAERERERGRARRALLCARCHIQVFIRSAERLGEGAFVRVNHCGLCVFCTTNTPPRQMESVLVQAFMGANWWRMGQRSTLTALTFSSPLLTY